MKHLFAVLAASLFLAVIPTPGHATHMGSNYRYTIVGYSADGKYVYFERTDRHPMEVEVWLRVYDVAIGKVVKSSRVFRNCVDSCDRGQPMSKKYGAKVRAKIYGKFGAPTAGSKLEAQKRTKGDIAKGAGYVQAFAAKGRSVTTVLRLRGKLGDPMETGDYLKAQFDVSITMAGPGGKRAGKKKIWTSAIENTDNANIVEWPELYVQHASLSPTLASAAIIFGRKPFVVALEPAVASGR